MLTLQGMRRPLPINSQLACHESLVEFVNNEAVYPDDSCSMIVGDIEGKMSSTVHFLSFSEIAPTPEGRESGTSFLHFLIFPSILEKDREISEIKTALKRLIFQFFLLAHIFHTYFNLCRFCPQKKFFQENRSD